MTTHLSILCLLAAISGGNGKVENVTIEPRRIAPGGSFEIHITASDPDGLLGGFVLNMINEKANFRKDIEYMQSDLRGDREGDATMIVGPGENSRFGDAEVTDQWPAGSVTRLRVLVRDMNDDRTAVDVGEVEVVQAAMKKAEPAKPTRGKATQLNATFDDGTFGGAAKPQYVNRHSSEDLSGKLISKLENGVLTMGARFDKAAAGGAGDYVTLSWRDLGVSLTDSPVLELRFRASDKKAAILVQSTYEFADGSQKSPYFYATVDKPGEWVTQSNRLVGDASLPKPWTPRKLVSLDVWVMGDRPVTVEFDHVKLRGLNAKERQREDEWIALMKDYDPGSPGVLREFFPFGVYAAPPDTSSAHMIQHRQSFRIMSRHHLNFMKAGAPQRRGGKPIENPVGEMMPIIAAAKGAGIRLGLRMRYATYQFTEHGVKGIEDWARPFIDAIRDHPQVVCYDMGDERPLSALYEIVAAIAVFNRMDPTRPSALTFWDITSVRGFDPYLSVNAADIYPIQEGSKDDASSMYDFCRGVARDTNNKPQWIILQSFGNAPWREKHAYIMPTPAELRLMTWASLAGGARGIIYYSFSYDRYQMLADQWGNPTELLTEISRLGERIIPLGHRLLDAEVDFDSPIKCDNDKIIVGVLHAKGRNVRYVVVANKDTRMPQRGALTGATGSILNLESLQPMSSGAVDWLAPGGGRIYLIGDPSQFDAEAAALRALGRAEAHRSTTPDRTFAGLYNDRLPGALIVRKQLDAIGHLMGAVEPAMYEDNPDAKVVTMMNEHRKAYWAVHPKWASMYDQLLAGTIPDVSALSKRAEQVARAASAALADHAMYPGGPTAKAAIAALGR